MNNKYNTLVQEARRYHNEPMAGKIGVIPTKPCETQEDLSLAYTPGVAVPCLDIKKNPENAYKYTAKANLVAVVTNGSAVLGLGNIGALAGKPVMEGKGILFKKFADIDVFDIELNSSSPDEIIKACQMLEPTFGGINLEDIKAPECFIIEEALIKTMNIPVFHDDQHGTAIVGGAALINALKVVNKKIGDVKVVMNGAGASGLAIASLILNLGVKKENLIICDTKGVIYKGRTEGMNPYKEQFANDTTHRTLEEAAKGCDVLYGLSKKGAFSDNLIKNMAANPVIFALANPDPEITPEEVYKIRQDAVMATGRSDYPNQINNVMCFPFLFRGALDVRTSVINTEMKIAAANAIAQLAHENEPDIVRKAYHGKSFTFGKDYILPTPFDPRLLVRVSMAVAKAAMDTKVAKRYIDNFDDYRLELKTRVNPSKKMLIHPIKNARKNQARVGFAYAHISSILASAANFAQCGYGIPVLIGLEDKIRKTAQEMSIDIYNLEIIEPKKFKDINNYIKDYHKMFWISGATEESARRAVVKDLNRFAALLLKHNHIDAMVGYTNNALDEVVTNIADIIDLEENSYAASTSVMLANKYKSLVIADPYLQTDNDSEILAELILQTRNTLEKLKMKPNIALISHNNFGNSIDSHNIAEAIRLAKLEDNNLQIEGEMTLDTALNPLTAEIYPYSTCKGEANTLIFSNMTAAESTIKSLVMFGGFKICAKVVQGFSKSIQIADNTMEEDDILNIAVLAASNAKK